VLEFTATAITVLTNNVKSLILVYKIKWIAKFLHILVLPVYRFAIVEFEKDDSMQPRDQLFDFYNTKYIACRRFTDIKLHS
jgi:hypothetical protein